jgi:hypothetical protein
VTATKFDGLEMTETPDGRQIKGFVSGQTQARIVFDRRGEQVEVVCVTEDLACTQLSTLGALRGWKLVSAALEPYQWGFTH